MAALSLVCGFFYHDKVIFPVEIARDATVSELQQAIFSRLPPAAIDGCCAFQLKLFLAKHASGAWIEVEDADADLRHTLVDSSHLKELLAPRTLSDEKCFGREPALGDDHVHVLVILPATEAPGRPRKRPKRDRVKSTNLEGLWTFSELEREPLPSVPELAELLLRPLPFRLENCLKDREIYDACDPNGPLHSCVKLSSLINAFVLMVAGARRAHTTSVRAWQTLYDALLQIPFCLCAASGLVFDSCRNAAASYDSISSGQRKRPDVVFQYRGLVYLRGEEGVTDRQQRWIARHDLRAKMRGWSKIFYGNLPYILGYATAGDEIQIVAIESNEDFDGRCRMSVLSGFNIFDGSTALKVFYNLSFVLSLMVGKSERLYSYDIAPFDSNVNEKRTITMLDGVVERTIDQRTSSDFDRLVDVYKALERLSPLGSETTHLQTVEFMAVLSKTEKYGQLVVELAPIGVMLKDILTAIQYLHGCGYCHGDVAWRNVVHVPGSTGAGYWVLIDVDECRPPHTEAIYWNHPFKGELLCFQHDLYQVGKMLCDLRFEFAEDIAAVGKRLLSAIEDEQININELLAELNG